MSDLRDAVIKLSFAVERLAATCRDDPVETREAEKLAREARDIAMTVDGVTGNSVHE